MTGHSEPDVNPKSEDGRSTRWAEHRETRLLDLVRQIRTIIHEDGPELSMEEIAGRIGTSKSVLYRYFKDKTGLQVALGDYVLSRARARLTEAAELTENPRQSLTAMIETYLETVERSRNVFLYVNRPQQGASERTLRVFVRQIEEIVGNLLKSLVPEVSPRRVELWAAAVVGLVRAAADDWMNTDEKIRIPREDLTKDLTTILWDGVKSLATA